MWVHDRVYGEFEIAEPLVAELIEGNAMQRLKGVDQIGYSRAFYPGKEFSRFEHSLGVYFLLRRFGADLEEQAAGLLHDVSHSAFSHSIDFLGEGDGGARQDHQDNILCDFIMRTEIPTVLRKYGLRLDDVLEDSRHPLKERTLPELCADRIDYSLRTGVRFDELEQADAMQIVDSLGVTGGDWVFRDFGSAMRFAQLFYGQNIGHYASFTSAVMFTTVADYLRYALNKGYLQMDELYSTDNQVINSISPWLNQDTTLRLLWERMNRRVGYSNDPADYDTRIRIKSRVVDPLCLHNGEVIRISEIDRNWGRVVEEESRPKEYFIRFDR